MTDATSYELQFNGQEFRVVQLKGVELRGVGQPSQDLQLALQSASRELNGEWLFIPLKVRT